MFQIKKNDIEQILQDYQINARITVVSELQRYHYEQSQPDSKEVRLIIRVDLDSEAPIVIRFKNEDGVTIELIESQSRFAETLQKNGIITPTQFKANGRFATWYCFGGYDVIVTVEQYVENEIKVVDTEIAKKTGALLAKTHLIAKANQLHIQNNVLFDPFSHNDLFAYDAFVSIASEIPKTCKPLFDRIVNLYNDYMDILEPLKSQNRYAVQGDISECNLYLSQSGEVGVFDFNRAGDNVLFCDAVMQAVFEARLMDYPENTSDDYQNKVLNAFLDGYCSVQSFSQQEQQWYPYLYAIIDAFWSPDIRWNEDSFLNAFKSGNTDSLQKWLSIIWERLSV